MPEATLIAVDKAALDALLAEVRALRHRLDQVSAAPLPEWLPVRDYAKLVGRHPDTVRRWAKEGRVETKMHGGVILVRRP